MELRTKLAAFFSILLLYEQQAGLANLFPRGRTKVVFKFLSGPWKCGLCFPEQGVGILRGVALRCGVSNQMITPLRLSICECDGLITGMSWQNEPRPFPVCLTDSSSTE